MHTRGVQEYVNFSDINMAVCNLYRDPGQLLEELSSLWHWRVVDAAISLITLLGFVEGKSRGCEAISGLLTLICLKGRAVGGVVHHDDLWFCG